ncbi:MAG: SH3 domain-containing protein [Candidatus Sericytochromatia bacterium]
MPNVSHRRRFGAVLLSCALMASSAPALSAAPAASASGVPASASVLQPVDESVKEPELARTLRELQVIAGSRDLDALLKHVDPTIRCSFGDCGGLADFKAAWKLNSAPEKSELWPVLARMLTLGGVYAEGSKDQFFVPYVFGRFPVTLDAYTHGAITAEEVQLREAPRLDSKVLRQLNYDLVKLPPTLKLPVSTVAGETYPWYQVQTLDGVTGYVWGKYVYSPIDYRMGLARQADGGWKINLLVAGD